MVFLLAAQRLAQLEDHLRQSSIMIPKGKGKTGWNVWSRRRLPALVHWYSTGTGDSDSREQRRISNFVPHI